MLFNNRKLFPLLSISLTEQNVVHLIHLCTLCFKNHPGGNAASKHGPCETNIVSDVVLANYLSKDDCGKTASYKLQ